MTINPKPDSLPIIVNTPIEYDPGSNLSETQFFLLLEHDIPDIRAFHRINIRKLAQHIELNMGAELKRKYVNKSFVYLKKDFHNNQVIFHFTNRLMLALRRESAYLLTLNREDKDLCEWIKLISAFKKKKVKADTINMLTMTTIGLTTIELSLRKPKINLHNQYADDFFVKHQQLLKSINANKKGGLYLFHGQPGTGKSTYIRYLIHHLKRKVVFIPPSMAAELGSPGMTEVLIENANAVFIIEDAEELIVSRQGGQNSGISMLLNLTDGLLGESLGIQCIATFNTTVSRIDPALMRKGRLLGSHEFKALPVDKVRALLNEQQLDSSKVTRPMTLAEIYHFGEEEFFEGQENRIGFR